MRLTDDRPHRGKSMLGTWRMIGLLSTLAWALVSCSSGPSVRDLLEKAAKAPDPLKGEAFLQEVADRGESVRPELIKSLDDPDDMFAFAAAGALGRQPQKFRGVDVKKYILNHSLNKSLAAAYILDELCDQDSVETGPILTAELSRAVPDRMAIHELCRRVPDKVAEFVRKGKVPAAPLHLIKIYSAQMHLESLQEALRGK